MEPLPEFKHSDTFTFTQPPHPSWQPGVKQPIKEGEVTSTAENTSVVFHADKMEPGARYKLLIETVIPRPIAFVSSLSSAGVPNLAPFSYFNVICHDPPSLMVSVNNSRKGEKDTANNILKEKEFVVSIISEWFVEAANYASIDAPPSVSEFAISGLTPLKSEYVKAPRVGESAVSMECKLLHHYPLKNDGGVITSNVFIGRIVAWHIRKEIINKDGSINTAALKPVSRLGGNSYGRTVQAFDLLRPVWETERAKF